MVSLLSSLIFIYGCTQETEPTPVQQATIDTAKEKTEKPSSISAPPAEEGFVATILKVDPAELADTNTEPEPIPYAVDVSKTEITQKEFSDLMGWNPSFFGGCGLECMHNSTTDEHAKENTIQDDNEQFEAECFDVTTIKPFDCGPTCPVENISWYDALAYTNRLSERNGLSQCFILENIVCSDGSNVGTDAQKCMNNNQKGILSADLDVKFTQDLIFCEGYRLLTAEEWDQVALGADSGPLYTSEGNDGTLKKRGCSLDENLDKIAWYGANSQGVPHPVAQKAPNKIGVYDMLGNVGEWVFDTVERPDLEEPSLENPIDLDTLSEDAKKKREDEQKIFLVRDRQQKGGSWLEYGFFCQVEKNTSMPPSERDASSGFRIIRTTKQP